MSVIVADDTSHLTGHPRDPFPNSDVTVRVRSTAYIWWTTVARFPVDSSLVTVDQRADVNAGDMSGTME